METMDVGELRRRLSLLEHDRPAVMTLRDKDSGVPLARCTAGSVMELAIEVLGTPSSAQGPHHWLWRYLRCAGPLADGGPVLESLRRLAQGLGGESVQQIAAQHLEQSELMLERRRGRQV